MSDPAVATLEKLRESWGSEEAGVQIVISDGLNARALMDKGHLAPYLEKLRKELASRGFGVARENIVVSGGRVRVGYRIGELLFGKSRDQTAQRAVIHIIGERPGTGHNNFSAYLAAASGEVWSHNGQFDHDLAKVVSGISDTAFKPELAAKQTVEILMGMVNAIR